MVRFFSLEKRHVILNVPSPIEREGIISFPPSLFDESISDSHLIAFLEDPRPKGEAWKIKVSGFLGLLPSLPYYLPSLEGQQGSILLKGGLPNTFLTLRGEGCSEGAAPTLLLPTDILELLKASEASTREVVSFLPLSMEDLPELDGWMLELALYFHIPLDRPEVSKWSLFGLRGLRFLKENYYLHDALFGYAILPSHKIMVPGFGELDVWDFLEDPYIFISLVKYWEPKPVQDLIENPPSGLVDFMKDVDPKFPLPIPLTTFRLNDREWIRRFLFNQFDQYCTPSNINLLLDLAEKTGCSIDGYYDLDGTWVDDRTPPFNSTSIAIKVIKFIFRGDIPLDRILAFEAKLLDAPIRIPHLFECKMRNKMSKDGIRLILEWIRRGAVGITDYPSLLLIAPSRKIWRLIRGEDFSHAMISTLPKTTLRKLLAFFISEQGSPLEFNMLFTHFLPNDDFPFEKLSNVTIMLDRLKILHSRAFSTPLEKPKPAFWDALLRAIEASPKSKAYQFIPTLSSCYIWEESFILISKICDQLLHSPRL